MTSSKASVLLRKGKDILREEGLLALVKRAFLFVLRSLFFSHEIYYIYEKTLNDSDEVKLTSRIQNWTLKIVSEPEHVDELVTEGFNIGWYFGPEEIKKRVSRRAVLFCVFVGNELAHVTWVALGEKAKRKIDGLPFKIDFQKGEVCSGASLTKPQYRGRGILSYTYSHIFPYLAKQGFVKDKFTVHENNIHSQRAHSKLNPTTTRRGRCLKILWWKFWREKPMKELQQ